MEILTQDDQRLIGLSLPSKTYNANGQSAKDCGKLWTKFEIEDIQSKIPGKLDSEVLAVYHEYEGDYTMPFSYFIGCRVSPETVVPEGMDMIRIPGDGKYKKFIAKGAMPDCVAKVWREIWASEIDRAYQPDYEVYDERSNDWSDATVEVFISVK